MMRKLRDFIGMYRLLRSGGNTVRFSIRHSWQMIRDFHGQEWN